jgi:hypothetical protein
MNTNSVVTTGWSNFETKQLFASRWPDEPALLRQYKNRYRCGSCSFFGKLPSHWGLCCHPKSRHHLETVFEHFTCPLFCREHWGPHSFTNDVEYHCRCGGSASEYWDNLIGRVNELVRVANGKADKRKVDR